MVIENQRNCILFILNYLRRNPEVIIADLLEACVKQFSWHDGDPRAYCRGHQDFIFLDSMETLAGEGFVEIGDGDYEGSIDGRKYYPRNAKVIMTAKLAKLQKIIGFSLTELLDDSLFGNTIKVRSIWDYPQKTETDVFVIMPFDTKFKSIYDDHIKRVCKSMSLTCMRADDIFMTHAIMKDIWSFIYNTKVVICDCTNKNPNVFYELGMAHAIGKNVIIITQNEDDIPFDIKQLRYLQYDYTPSGMSKFEDILKLFIEKQLETVSKK